MFVVTQMTGDEGTNLWLVCEERVDDKHQKYLANITFGNFITGFGSQERAETIANLLNTEIQERQQRN